MQAASVVGALAAGVRTAPDHDGFRVPFAVALMVVGGVLSLGGSSVLSRAGTTDVRTFFGLGPDRDEPWTGEDLTTVGVLLVVSLPLFGAGLVLFGSG